MIRTQVQLTEEQVRELRRAAREKGVSLAEVVRRCIDRGLAEDIPARHDRYGRAARLVGALADPEAVPDLSVHHDRYLDEAFE